MAIDGPCGVKLVFVDQDSGLGCDDILLAMAEPVAVGVLVEKKKHCGWAYRFPMVHTLAKSSYLIPAILERQTWR